MSTKQKLSPNIRRKVVQFDLLQRMHHELRWRDNNNDDDEDYYDERNDDYEPQRRGVLLRHHSWGSTSSTDSNNSSTSSSSVSSILRKKGRRAATSQHHDNDLTTSNNKSVSWKETVRQRVFLKISNSQIPNLFYDRYEIEQFREDAYFEKTRFCFPMIIQNYIKNYNIINKKSQQENNKQTYNIQNMPDSL